MLAADDGRAAVEALVRDAVASDANGRATSPTSSTVEGVKVTRASFVIDAGGWDDDVPVVNGCTNSLYGGTIMHGSGAFLWQLYDAKESGFQRRRISCHGHS